jgi:hypothetical protein
MPLIAGFPRQFERAEEAKDGKDMQAPEVSIYGVPPRGFTSVSICAVVASIGTHHGETC